MEALVLRAPLLDLWTLTETSFLPVLRIRLVFWVIQKLSFFPLANIVFNMAFHLFAEGFM